MEGFPGSDHARKVSKFHECRIDITHHSLWQALTEPEMASGPSRQDKAPTAMNAGRCTISCFTFLRDLAHQKSQPNTLTYASTPKSNTNARTQTQTWKISKRENRAKTHKPILSPITRASALLTKLNSFITFKSASADCARYSLPRMSNVDLAASARRICKQMSPGMHAGNVGCKLPAQVRKGG